METSLPWPELACLPYWFEIVAFFLLSVTDCSSIALLMYQIFCISLGFSSSKNHKIYTRIYVSNVDDTALHLLTDELTWSNWFTEESNNWISDELWMTLRAVLLRTMRWFRTPSNCSDEIYEWSLRTIKRYFTARLLRIKNEFANSNSDSKCKIRPGLKTDRVKWLNDTLLNECLKIVSAAGRLAWYFTSRLSEGNRKFGRDCSFRMLRN